MGIETEIESGMERFMYIPVFVVSKSGRKGPGEIPTMSEYLHPVSRATEEQTAETIEGLNKSELVYVLADAYGLDAPTDDEGDEIHPDDYNGNVSRDMLLSLVFEGYGIDEESDDEGDDEGDDEEAEEGDDEEAEEGDNRGVTPEAGD